MEKPGKVDTKKSNKTIWERKHEEDGGERKEIGEGLGAVRTDGRGVLEHLGQRNGVKSLRNGRDF